MTQSVMGTGLGGSDKYTTKELAILSNGPSILVAGQVELAEDFLVNPPTPTATVTLGVPLPGSKSNYVVLVTGLNVDSIYVATMTNNGDGDFASFRVIGSQEGICMYAIMKIGNKPKL